MVAISVLCEIAFFGVHQQYIWVDLLKGFREPLPFISSLKNCYGPNFAPGSYYKHKVYVIFGMYSIRVRVDENTIRVINFLATCAYWVS